MILKTAFISQNKLSLSLESVYHKLKAHTLFYKITSIFSCTQFSLQPLSTFLPALISNCSCFQPEGAN